MTANRMRTAFRMLAKTVSLLMETDQAGISGLHNGRLAVRLRRRVARLKGRLQDGPEELFWAELQKAILDAIKYTRRIDR